MKSLLSKLGIIISLFVLIPLLGCTYKQRNWYKPDMTEVELKRDSYECEKDTIATGYSWVRSDAFFKRCMEGKGYKLVKDEVRRDKNIDSPVAESRVWILWYCERLTHGTLEDTKWKVVNASPDFNRCSESKNEQFKILSTDVRAMHTLATVKPHEDFVVSVAESQDEITLVFYNKKEPLKSLTRTFRLVCFPEGTDPKRLESK